MAAGFIRRFLFDPGIEELTAIEGVVIIDREPPATISGVGAGTVLVAGEFENGPFDTPIEVASSGDLLSTFGGFGYTYDGVVSSHPCARVRKSDGAIIKEFWNGNGFIALVNKRFRRLIVCRVDTSIGEVSFTRLAALSGSANFNFNLESGEHIDIKLNGAAAVVATFTGVVATLNSAAGTYPSTFTGGEWIEFKIDGGPVIRATFLAVDQTQAQVVARLNLAAGYTAFSVQGGNVTRFEGLKKGTGGSVEITARSGAIITTATGFSIGAPTAGTGNVSDIDQVTLAEVKTIVEAAVAGTLVDRDSSGRLRISNKGTPATGTIEIAAPSTADGLGFTELVVATAVTGDANGIIPAGTRVKTNGGLEFVTMQDVAVSADNAGPYKTKIRHAVDDTLGAGTGVTTVVNMTSAIPLGSFAVTNDLPINAALTESQIDAKYVTALSKTKNLSSIAKETNIIFSARSSNAVRSQLRTNALEASEGGSFGRVTVIRPPLKTTRAAAKSTSVQPGVGAYRNQRVVYAFPGAQTFVPQIAARGLAGGEGFTADGLIDTGFDAWVCSAMSQLNPEENPGQETDFMSGITAIEAGNSDVQEMEINDYKAFRAAGIAALRIDGGKAFIQSGVTSVDPLVTPNLRNIARRRMADFIQDSLAIRLTAFNKKLATRLRRALILGEIDAFMRTLLSPNQPSLQRIDGYFLDGKSGNSKETLALGIFRIILKVRTLPSLDTIVLDTEVGESVEITETALAA